MTEAKAPISRRRFLSLWSAALLGGGLVTLDSFLVEPNWLDVSHFELAVPDLPDELVGYRIAHITDTHLGNFASIHRRVIAAVRGEDPDLICCTGDMVEMPRYVDQLDTFLLGMADLDADVLITLGNWEHSTSTRILPMIAESVSNHDARLLVNENIRLSNGIVVAGADDPITGFYSPEETFSGLPDAPVRIFLIHAPGILAQDARVRPTFDLVLAGHTHGGQIRIGPFAPFLPRGSGRFVDGFYDTAYGRTYVSRGIGTTTVPARFGARPELPIFTLTRRKPDK